MTERVNGYCKNTRTVVLTQATLCTVDGLVGTNQIPLVNNPTIVEQLFDIVDLQKDGIRRYIPIDGVIGLNTLYRVVDSPSLHFDLLLNTVYEPTVYYIDKSTNVGVVIDVGESEVEGYHLIHRLLVTREPDKIERVRKFMYHHCTATPVVITKVRGHGDLNDPFTINRWLSNPTQK